MSSNPKPRLVGMVGATATGKTQFSLDIAESLDGEIINCDSRLFYRGMDVATAKPNIKERRGITHHIIDILDPNEQYSLAEHLKAARQAVVEIISRGNLPIIVGGSGQYVWALLEGWNVPKIEPDPDLRAELESIIESRGIEYLAEQLNETAPEIANRTDLSNPRRVVRAMERITHDVHNSITLKNKPDDPPYDSLVIGLTVDRKILHKRVIKRIECMKHKGWVEEVQHLHDIGLNSSHRAMSGIGYKQMLGHINGDYDLDEAVRLTTVATNRLIRQQANWFRNDDDRITWFDVTNNDFNTRKSIIQHVHDWIATK